jgi:hypothetical protein
MSRAVLVLVLVPLLVTALPARAGSATATPYVDAVQRAYELIQNASPADSGPAEQAVKVLTDGTGASQPEIVADLKARPPLYDDARARLSALLASVLQPMKAADPALARQRMHGVLSMSRYDALHRPPSLIDRFTQWVEDRVGDLLALLFGRATGGQIPSWLFYAAGIAIVAAVVFVLVRAARGRFGQTVTLAPSGPRAPADFFAEADRLAAAGDRVGAIRALCAAVAATLAGERSWEGSPLTVREIFQRAPDFAGLSQLLHPFEAAVYGGRDVDTATYERAARIAARFRASAQVAA